MLCPKLTIITVCFKASALINATIQSVINQTYKNIEYIIIDGKSNDGTEMIVQLFGNKINKFVCEPDTGLYGAMNKGIRIATGDLILFLNAGDYFVSKNVVEFTVSKMNLKDADLFFGRIVWNDPRSNEIVLSDHSTSNYTWDLRQSNFPHPATFYKKRLFETVGYFDLDYPIAADYKWNVKALVAEKVKFQYIDIIVTVFFADGISNNPSFELQHKSEISKVNRQYFQPDYIFRIISHLRSLPLFSLTQKITSKLYKNRLNRIFY